MCVPLGHRNGGSCSHGSIKTKISKSEVETIIKNTTYDICQWKRVRCRIYRDY